MSGVFEGLRMYVCVYTRTHPPLRSTVRASQWRALAPLTQGSGHREGRRNIAEREGGRGVRERKRGGGGGGGKGCEGIRENWEGKE